MYKNIKYFYTYLYIFYSFFFLDHWVTVYSQLTNARIFTTVTNLSVKGIHSFITRASPKLNSH